MTRKKHEDGESLVYQPIEDNSNPIILMYGGIDDQMIASASGVILDAHRMDPLPEKITIYINSEGGDLHSAFALIELIRASRITIETVALGQCVSAGLIIFMSGHKGWRTITPTTTVMSHTYSTELEGNHFDLQSMQRELKHTQNRLLDHYKNCTGLKGAKIKKKLIGKIDRWLTPKEVVKLGLADRVSNVIM